MFSRFSRAKRDATPRAQVVSVFADDDARDTKIAGLIQGELAGQYPFTLAKESAYTTLNDTTFAAVGHLLVVLSPALFSQGWRVSLVRHALELHSRTLRSRHNYIVPAQSPKASPPLNALRWRGEQRRQAARSQRLKVVIVQTAPLDPDIMDSATRALYDQLLSLQMIDMKSDPNTLGGMDDARLFQQKQFQVKRAFDPGSTSFAFFSHAGAQKPIALAIRKQFEEQQHDIWVDQREILPATVFWEEIYKGILSSQIFFFLFTPEALASPWCYQEFQYARGLHKKIVPLRLDSVPIDAFAGESDRYRAVLDARNAAGRDDKKDQLSYQQVADLYSALHALDPILLDFERNATDSLTDACMTALNNAARLQPIAAHPTPSLDPDLIDQHTNYLIMADRWQQEEGELLNGGALRQAKDWIQQRERVASGGMGNVPYQVTALHRRYVQASAQAWRNARLRAGAIIAVVLSTVFVLFSLQQTVFAQRERDGQIVLNKEIDQRLQTLAQLNRRFGAIGSGIIPTPNGSILMADALWVSSLNGMAIPVALTSGQVTAAPLDIGADPSAMVAAGTDIWLVSRNRTSRGLQFNRIDTRARTVTTYPIPINILDYVFTAPPLVGGGWVWMQPNAEMLVGIAADAPAGSPAIVLAVPHDPILGTPATAPPLLVHGEALWMLNGMGQPVTRIDIACVVHASADITPFEGCVQVRVEVSTVGDTQGADKPLWIAAGDTLLFFDVGTDQNPARIPLGGTIHGVRAAPDGAWVVVGEAGDEQIVFVDALAWSERRRWSFSTRINALHVLDTGAYVYDVDEKLTILDARRDQPVLASLLTPGLNRAPAPIAAGDLVWLILPASNNIKLIDALAGQIVRSIAVCENPIAPQFDGANLWLLCAGEDDPQTRVMALPSQLIYIGEDRANTDQYDQSPLVIGATVWAMQEDSGQIVVATIQTNDPSARRTFPLPHAQTGTGSWRLLFDDGRSVWAMRDTPGVILRIDPDRGAIPDTLRYTEVGIDGTITGVNRIGGALWVRHTNLSRLNDPASNLTVIDATTLRVVDASLGANSAGTFVSSINPIDDGTVWIGAGRLDAGEVYAIDSAIDFDAPIAIDTIASRFPDFIVFSVFEFEDRLWFNYGSGILSAAMESITRDPQTTTNDTSSSYMVAYRPEQAIWDEPIVVPGFAYAPAVDRSPVVPAGSARLWYTLSAQPLTILNTMIEPAQNNAINRVFAIDIPNGTPIGTWELDCPSLTALGLYGDYFWVGCMLGDAVFAIPRAGGTPIVHHGLGQYPLTPLIVGNKLLIIFRDSGTAAWLNIRTGELERALRLGPSPSAPFYVGESIWTYNSTDGTLQTIES